MKKHAILVSLPAEGIEAVLVELSPSEMLTAMKLAGNDTSDTARGMRVSREGLRLSVRRINGDEVTYQDLAGDGWRKRFPRTRQTMALSREWSKLHQPTSEEVEQVKASMAVAAAGDEELWTAMLPGGRVVVLAEQAPELVDEAMRAAEASATAAAAQSFQSAIESARRSLRAVDGRPVRPEDLAGAKWDATFSVKETHLLDHLWSVIHVGDAAVEVSPGEAMLSGPGGTASPG